MEMNQTLQSVYVVLHHVLQIQDFIVLHLKVLVLLDRHAAKTMGQQLILLHVCVVQEYVLPKMVYSVSNQTMVQHGVIKLLIQLHIQWF